MLAGILMAIKHEKPEVQVIGLEPINFASCAEALHQQKAVEIGFLFFSFLFFPFSILFFFFFFFFF